MLRRGLFRIGSLDIRACGVPQRRIFWQGSSVGDQTATSDERRAKGLEGNSKKQRGIATDTGRKRKARKRRGSSPVKQCLREVGQSPSLGQEAQSQSAPMEFVSRPEQALRTKTPTFRPMTYGLRRGKWASSSPARAQGNCESPDPMDLSRALTVSSATMLRASVSI